MFRRRSIGVFLTMVLLVGLPAVAAAQLSQFTPPTDISVEGHRADSLFYSTTVLLLILFVILVILLFVPAFLHREGSKHKVHYHPGNAPRDLTIATLISATIFFVVDGNLLYNSYVDIKEVWWNYREGEPGITRVQIMPQQWAWRFRLPGNDGEFNTADDIVTFNELHVPKDTRVAAQLKSRDVIHSFFLPNVRQKQDANPGAVTRMTFTPTQAGTYEVVCAEMCGIAHYKMRAEMMVHDAADFAVWHEEASRWAAASYDPDDAEAQWGWEWEAR